MIEKYEELGNLHRISQIEGDGVQCIRFTWRNSVLDLENERNLSMCVRQPMNSLCSLRFVLTTRNSVETPFGIRFVNLSKIEIVYNFNTKNLTVAK